MQKPLQDGERHGRRWARSWFPERLAPDDMFEGFENSQAEVYDLPVGTRAIGALYD